jgi:methionyl-tRNA synthetase
MTRPAFYITTPIYYVNAEPHIGHTYTTVLADAIVRYHRLCGDQSFMLTGSDEHGEKVMEVAANQGKTAQEVAEYYSLKFKAAWDDLGIDYDRFIRTTEADHKAVVQKVLQQVYDDGHIEFREYEGDYCVGCERFLTDRDLVDGLCRDHERAPEKRNESNYFFKMTEHFDWLAQYIEDQPDFIRPKRYRNEVLSMIKEESGLGDLCISRPKKRLEWGIELPFDENYVCYVWFDALINYLTGIGYPAGKDFEQYWGVCEHLIAKDILKPHGVFWPTMLHAIGLPLPRHISVHGYWNVDNRKISKSLGNMIDPYVMRDKYGFEPFRYFLLREMPFGLDANFSESGMVARLNADLANNLGNLVSRTLNMTKKFSDGVVPEPGEIFDEEREVHTAAEAALDALRENMKDFRANRALEGVMLLGGAANRYLETREPWKAAKDPELAERVRTTLYTCCESIRILAVLLSPFIPEKSREILQRLGIGDALEGAVLPEAAAWGAIPVGSPTTKGSPLFPRHEAPDEPEA